MWQKAREFIGRVVSRSAPPRIYMASPPVQAEGVVVEIALGEFAGAERLADARLTVTGNTARVREVVRFCAGRRLPVSAWCVTGLWEMPARVEQIARWVYGLASEAGDAPVWIARGKGGGRRRSGMSARFERRLVGHLRRFGCEVN